MGSIEEDEYEDLEILVEVPFKRKRKPDHKEVSWSSPINLKEKTAIKADLGALHFENMWKPSTNSLITNTGSNRKFDGSFDNEDGDWRHITQSLQQQHAATRRQKHLVRLELTSPGHVKWKTAGDVSYNLSNVEFLWAFDNYGSAHLLNGQRFAAEMIWSFQYNYALVVPSDLLAKRIDLHIHYRRLASKQFIEEETNGSAERLIEKEVEFDIREESILSKRYIHSEAQEALHHRKPTSYNLGFKNITVADNDDDDDDDDDDKADDDKGVNNGKDSSPENINFYRDIKFSKERVLHELAAERFYPYFLRGRKSKGSLSSDLDIDAYFATSAGVGTTELPIDSEMFPTERSKEREKARRALFRESKKRRDQEEEEKLSNWIRLHDVKINLKISCFFEVKPEAPYYSLFSYLPRVTEPFSRILVDGNVLLPFQQALDSPDYFAYKGSRLFNHSEDVIWIVQKYPLPILEDQLWSLRNLKNEYGKLMEQTPVINPQEINGRPIFFNVPTPEIEPPTCPGKQFCRCEDEIEFDWKSYRAV